MSGEKATERAKDGPDYALLLREALVPEHSAPFMEAMSGGRAFVHGGLLFLAGEGWLTCIGYPLDLAGQDALSAAPAGGGPGEAYGSERSARSNGPDAYSAPPHPAIDAFPEELEGVIASALVEAVRLKLIQASDCRDGRAEIFAVAPAFPESLREHVTERDVFYTLPATAPVPPPLLRHVRAAAGYLRVEEGCEFTPAHRRLWSEFLARPEMRSNVREMYAKTEALLRGRPDGVSLLNAWDGEDRLAASLLLDFAPRRFCSYIIGAHSRRAYVPHATDLLFARMLELARQRGKEYIHLGLGVNEGIARFKRKWGGLPGLPFQMASWQADLPQLERGGGMLGGVMRGLANMPSGESKQQIFNSLPPQKPYAMLWELEKNGRRSWIGGTAHFFQCTFERSFEKLFEKVDNVIFEGPLDPESLACFERSGRTRLPGDPCLYDLLTGQELEKLRRTVRGPEGGLHRLLNHEAANKADVDDYLKNTRPWFAFFSLWTAFLERHGWRQSVDLDAWNQARDMGKAVIAMENREEQLASLESVPPERIIDFFRNCHEWPRRMRQNLKTYLLGDLGGMAGTSTEFPTRIHSVIGLRDHRFCERMLPFITQGRSMVFVGSAHMIGLRVLLAEQGFKVTKVSPGPLHRLKTIIHGKLHKDADLA